MTRKDCCEHRIPELVDVCTNHGSRAFDELTRRGFEHETDDDGITIVKAVPAQVYREVFRKPRTRISPEASP